MYSSDVRANISYHSVILQLTYTRDIPAENITSVHNLTKYWSACHEKLDSFMMQLMYHNTVDVLQDIAGPNNSTFFALSFDEYEMTRKERKE